MHTLAELNAARFKALQGAATGIPADGAALRTLIAMLSCLDLAHWAKHGTMLSLATSTASSKQPWSPSHGLPGPGASSWPGG